MKRRTRKQLPMLLGLSTALIAATGGFGYMAYEAASAVVADHHGCFEDFSGRHTVVWVDASPPTWNDEQRRSLRNRLDQLYEGLGFNERLSVFTTEGDIINDVPEPRFHVCGQARSSHQLEAIGASPARAGFLKRQKERLYERVLAPELDALLAKQPDAARVQNHQSPILEQLVALSHRREIESGSKLVIISDLLQNSDSSRFCLVQMAMPKFAVFRKRSIYQERLKPNSLAGVDVEVLMLQRYGYGQKNALPYCRNEEEIKAFYRDYLVAAGVRSPRFLRIRQGRS